MLDSDEIRSSLVPRPGYSAEERDAFYETLARLAALFSEQGLVVVVAATSNRAAYRARARGLAPRFIEVYVQTPLEESAQRDSKRLYAQARAGRAPSFPGVGETYEAPEKPDVVASGGFDEGAIERALAALDAAHRLEPVCHPIQGSRSDEH
jgi:adenylylsulfate kinase